jgi:hypothetical protein
MATRSQVARMRQQRKATYGLIEDDQLVPGQAVLIASDVAGPMIGGNLTVFPLGIAGVVPTDVEIVTQRMAPGAGALGDTNVDSVTPGVGGSFRIHSSAGTEVSFWQYFVYSKSAALV